MSEETSAGDSEDPHKTDAKPIHHRIFQAEINGETYCSPADSKQDARLRAANRYKAELSESAPCVGISVEEYATNVDLTPLRIDFQNPEPFEGVVESEWDVANGDPYIAVVYRWQDGSNPTDHRTITLGTGFESYKQILYDIARFIQSPEFTQHDPLEFVPTNIEIYSIVGSSSIEYIE